jgi:hypothetical protein
MMQRVALIAVILSTALGCNKKKPPARTAQAADTVPVAPPLDLAQHPEVLFQLFGEATDTRMVPVAAIMSGALKPIELTTTGWRQFDALYARADERYALYRDGARVGAARIQRGMWGGPTAEHTSGKRKPLYSLPGCDNLTPLSAVALETDRPIGVTAEYLATTSGVSPVERAAVPPTMALQDTARRLLESTSAQGGITIRSLPISAFRSVALNTGISDSPTVVAWVLDPNSTDRDGTTTHVLVIADRRNGGGYTVDYRHLWRGPVAQAEFRRYVDHLDVTGDGVDEIMLEGWHFGGDTFLGVLGYRDGQWTEVFRGRSSWCLDPKPH